MLKRYFVLFVLLSNFAFAMELKDPKLIATVEYKKLGIFSQKKKCHLDKKKQQKFKELLSKEDYAIYLIADKLIRANNLQFKNWRIGFNIEKDVINAVSLNNNLILINSSLYDCLHQNNDALAFALAHEIAHFLLMHQKETIENSYKIKKIEENINKLNTTLQGELYSRNLKNLINNIYNSQRKLELEADSLAMELILKAGYNFDLALEIFEYIDEDYGYYEGKNIYPLIYERKENLLCELELLDIEKLAKEGENNLYFSNILTVQKSMDKETLVINKPDDYKKYEFSVVDKYQKILEKAYGEYSKENFNNAIKFFLKANEYNPEDYIPLLYLSYCYENIDDIKFAKRYIKKAKKLKSKDKNILEQYKSLYKKY